MVPSVLSRGAFSDRWVLWDDRCGTKGLASKLEAGSRYISWAGRRDGHGGGVGVDRGWSSMSTMFLDERRGDL